MQKSNDIKEVFREQYRPLCIYCVHFVGDIDVAEDLVMDCFVRLSEKINRGERIVSMKRYTYMMVRNASMDYCRGRRMVTTMQDVPDGEADDTEWQERCEREARLWTEIDRLPDTCRKVLLMSKCEGLKNREIAERLNVSVKTVEAHISKAYATLRGKAKEIYMMFF